MMMNNYIMEGNEIFFFVYGLLLLSFLIFGFRQASSWHIGIKVCWYLFAVMFTILEFFFSSAVLDNTYELILFSILVIELLDNARKMGESKSPKENQ